MWRLTGQVILVAAALYGSLLLFNHVNAWLGIAGVILTILLTIQFLKNA